MPLAQASVRMCGESRLANMKICLLMLGKTRRQELSAVLEDYVKRISRSAPIEVLEVRDAAAALHGHPA